MFVLISVVACLAAVVMLLAIAVVAHHVVTARRRRRFARRLNAAATFLAPYVVSGAGLATAAAEACRRWGRQPVAAVLRRSRDVVDGAARAGISCVLFDIGEVGTLSAAAGSQRDEERLEAVRGLAEDASPTSQTLLAAAADHDPLPEVRRAAREGLLSIGSPAAVHAATRTYLRDGRRAVGWGRGFFAHMAEAAPADLRVLIGSGQLTHDEEKLALEALGDASDEDSAPIARVWLRSSDRERRATAARVLGKLGDHHSAPAIQALLHDPVWFVRVAAAQAMEATSGGPPAMEALGGALSDPEWWVRARAARSLSRSGRVGIAALFDAVGGPDRYARDAALAALGRLELPPEANELLGEAVIALETLEARENDHSLA